MKSLQIRSYFWSEYRKIRTRSNSVFGHFSRSVMASVKQPKKLNYKLKIPRSLRDGTWQTSFNSSLTNRNRSKWKSKNSLNFASKKLFYKIYNHVVGDYVEAKKFSFCLHVQHEKLRHCPDSFFLLILFPTSQCFRMPGQNFCMQFASVFVLDIFDQCWKSSIGYTDKLFFVSTPWNFVCVSMEFFVF